MIRDLLEELSGLLEITPSLRKSAARERGRQKYFKTLRKRGNRK